MGVQLKSSEEDSDRLRTERERLRDGLSELQTALKEKESEVKITGWPLKINCTGEI